MYTQSQKKRTMNLLTFPVTQGQGQVPLAGHDPGSLTLTQGHHGKSMN